MLVPTTKTIWHEKVGTHDFGVGDVILPVTSVPITSVLLISIHRISLWNAGKTLGLPKVTKIL